MVYITSNKAINMRVINSKTHAILDYLLVAALLLSPTLFGMEGGLATFTYVLGVVHMALTALTAFEYGLVRVIPFGVHGMIELVVGLGLLGTAFYFRSHEVELGFRFYLALSLVIIGVFLLTDFTAHKTLRHIGRRP